MVDRDPGASALKEATMRSTRFISLLLVLTGFIALAAPAAYAGGGQGGGITAAFPWQCYVINGEQPPASNSVVNLVDQFGERQNVRLGPARLLCAPATATKPDGGFFDTPPVLGDHLTCYTVSPFEREDGRTTLYNPDATVDYNDEFNTDKGIRVSIPTFLCTTADKTACSGSDCPPVP